MMKNIDEIQQTLSDCYNTRNIYDKTEYSSTDYEINEGWIEALEYVLDKEIKPLNLKSIPIKVATKAENLAVTTLYSYGLHRISGGFCDYLFIEDDLEDSMRTSYRIRLRYGTKNDAESSVTTEYYDIFEDNLEIKAI